MIIILKILVFIWLLYFFKLKARVNPREAFIVKSSHFWSRWLVSSKRDSTDSKLIWQGVCSDVSARNRTEEEEFSPNFMSNVSIVSVHSDSILVHLVSVPPLMFTPHGAVYNFKEYKSKSVTWFLKRLQLTISSFRLNSISEFNPEHMGRSFWRRDVIKPIWFLVFTMKIQHDCHLSTSYNVITSPRRRGFSLCQLAWVKLPISDPPAIAVPLIPFHWSVFCSRFLVALGSDSINESVSLNKSEMWCSPCRLKFA